MFCSRISFLAESRSCYSGATPASQLWFLNSQCAMEKCVLKSKTSFGILRVPKPSWSVTEVVAQAISSVAFCGVGLNETCFALALQAIQQLPFFFFKARSALNTWRVSTCTIEYKLIHTPCRSIIKINTN